MKTKEQADAAALERIYGRMIPVSSETAEYLDKLEGTTLDEKLMILNERINDLEHKIAKLKTNETR